MKFHLSRVRLNTQGYTPEGYYYGIGLPLWTWRTDPDTNGYSDSDTFRARDRAAAKALVRAAFPTARFYR